MKKESKYRKKKIDLFNLGIIFAVILIIIAAITLIFYYFGDNINIGGIIDNIGSKISSIGGTEEPREKAIEVACKEFKKLGEDKVEKDKLEVVNINKDGVESYYIKSTSNSVEVRKEDYKIIRINGKKI